MHNYIVEIMVNYECFKKISSVGLNGFAVRALLQASQYTLDLLSIRS